MPQYGRGWFGGPRRRSLAGALAFAALACMDSANGPDGAGVGYLALQPVLPAQVQNGQFSLGVDQIGLRLLRTGTGEIVVDTLIPFDVDSPSVHAAVRVGMLSRTEEFEARLTLLSGSLVLFSGSKLVFLEQGPAGTNKLDSIGVRYEGPGRSIAEIAIQPADTVLTFGDSLRFRVAAVDSSGAPVGQFFVSWGVSDTAVGRLNALGVLRAPGIRTAVTVTALTPNGAAAAAHARFVPLPAGLRLVGSDTLVAPVGTAATFAVRVVAADSLGVPGIAVRFAAATAGGAVTDSVVVSDSAGVAVTQVLIGNDLKRYAYEARAGSLTPGHLTVAAIAGPPAALSVVSGDLQSGEVGTQLAQPVAVRVRDALGNPVAGQRVNFVVTSGGGSVWAGSNNTNDSGVAMERWTLGTSTAPAQRLEARAVDNATGAPLLFAVFSAVALPGLPDSLGRVAGDGQAGVVGSALPESLVVRVADRYGNPVPGAAVAWTADQGSIAAAEAASDAQGRSRAAWVMGPVAGASHASATVASIPAVQFVATAAAGPPSAVALGGGGVQTGTAGSVLAESLAVRVTDQFGNPAAGVSVTWTTGDGGTVTPAGPTGADGVAHATWRLGTVAGAQTVRAAVGDLSVVFEATVVSGPPAQVTVSSVDTVLNAIGSVLTVGAVVRDAFGNHVTGAAVGWTSSDTSVAVVDEIGRVTARRDGTVRITATVSGSVAGFLTLTVAQAVATIALTPRQATLEAVGASVQLQLTALDQNGYPVSGAGVTWESSDGRVATVSPSGLVTAVGPGDVTITATVSGEVVQAVTLSVVVSVVPVVARIDVAPGTATLSALGETVMLQGTPLDAQGAPVAGQTLAWRSSNQSVATVSPTGEVTAVGNGTATIEASAAGVTGSAQVTVSQRAASVAVSPASVSLTALGATAQLGATVRDANGHPIAGAAVTWASSDPGVATVSESGTVTAVANGSATITASSGGVSGSGTVAVTQVAPAVVVTPASVSLAALGATVQMAATVEDANGHPIAGAVVTWAVSDPGVANVDAGGLVTAIANGSATVTASSGGITGSAQVTVSQVSAAVVVSPASVSLTALDQTAQVNAVAEDANGHAVAGAALTWSSSDPGVASVDQSGVVTALANGTATITAASGAVAGVMTVTVSQTVSSVEVSPAAVSLSAVGQQATLTATARDARGNPVTGAVVSWSSGDEAVATVSGSGVVTAVANGSAVITAASGGRSGTATVTVAISPTTITVVIVVGQGNNKTVNLGSQGTTPVAVLTTSTSAGEPVTFDAATVNASSVRFAGAAPVNSSLEDVDGDGDRDLRLHFTTTDLQLTPGNATVTLTGLTRDGVAIEGHDDVVVIANSPPAPPPPQVGSVEVTPTSVTLSALGAVVQLAATVRATDQSLLSTAAVTWTSSNAGVVSVDAAGLVTAVASGTATVTASSNGVSGSAVVTVSQVPAVVAVSPSGVSFTALGTTAQLSAAVRDANGYAIPGAAVTWMASDPSVAAVNQSGLVSAIGVGSVSITAASGSASGSASVTVSQVVTSVEVAPASFMLLGGGSTATLEAKAFDANGREVAGASFIWSSSNEAVARVDQSGVVTSVSAGTATIGAAAGGVSGYASVTVVPPPAEAPPPSLVAVVVVKPGASEELKPINLWSQGVTPVAVLTTATSSGDPVTFDATTIDAGSVRFAGAAPVQWALSDVDGDGDLDWVFHFDTQQLQLTLESTSATLTGRTLGGISFSGSAGIRVVP